MSHEALLAGSCPPAVIIKQHKFGGVADFQATKVPALDPSTPPGPRFRQGDVWPGMVATRPSRLNLAPRIHDRQEPIRLQTLISQHAVEGLNKAVYCNLLRPDDVEQNARLVHPLGTVLALYLQSELSDKCHTESARRNNCSESRRIIFDSFIYYRIDAARAKQIRYARLQLIAIPI